MLRKQMLMSNLLYMRFKKGFKHNKGVRVIRDFRLFSAHEGTDSRGVAWLDGARGKNQVWRPHV